MSATKVASALTAVPTPSMSRKSTVRTGTSVRQRRAKKLCDGRALTGLRLGLRCTACSALAPAAVEGYADPSTRPGASSVTW
jgi:hypothetical protein